MNRSRLSAIGLALFPCALLLVDALPGAAQGPPLPTGSVPTLLPPNPGEPTFAARVHPEPATGTLSAVWRVAFVADDATRSTVAFVLGRDFEILTVEGEAARGVRPGEAPEGAPFRFHEVGLEGVVAGQPVELEITYSGAPVFGSDGMARLDQEWIELMLDAFWFPLFATFDQAMRGTLQIHLPEGWTVMSGATAVVENGVRTVEFPRPGPDAYFAAAPTVERFEAEGFVLFHREGDPNHVALVLEGARECAAYLNHRYGMEDPLRDLRILFTDRPRVSYQRDNYISIDGSGFSTLQEAHALLCHEMAHHWARGTNFMSPDHWMSEAFAEYVTARFIRERHGEEDFRKLVERWERASEGLGPVWTAELTGRPSEALMYRKAPALLARLEARIGEEAFDRFITRYMTESVTRTEELLSILSEEAGVEAAERFEAELAGG